MALSIVTTLPADSDTSSAVQLTGTALRISARVTSGGPATLALIRMNSSGKWYRATDDSGNQVEIQLTGVGNPGPAGTGLSGNTDWSFTLPAVGSNEWYGLLLDGGTTFTGTAELISISAPAAAGGTVPSGRALTMGSGLLIAGTSSADLSADRTIALDSTMWAISTSALTLVAGSSLTLAAGAGGLACGSGTGAWAMPTGNGSWAGASGSTLSLVSTAAAMTLTAGAASTWKTSAGALTVDSAAALQLGTTAATSVAIGNGSIAVAITSAGANSLAVGANGATNPTLKVDSSTASSATGLSIKSAAAAAGVALQVLSSGSNENLTINAKGTGTITVQSAVATPAAGSAAASLLFGSTAGFGIYYGSGAPTVSAGQGSVYLRSDGSSTSTRLYVNSNGSTTWVAVTTAS